ncbi:pyridoxal phosphate-dependent decarboxylase family protein [Dactylosporangium sp. McL0621]|uniref:pyridoxal phosphate-dependent decarboxylase family protein n=1 Tax=Dactylosporangium sp. McL0621 TaxID=3415678 RepID=UPI003CEC2B31
MTHADEAVLGLAAEYANEYLAGLATRPVGATAGPAQLEPLLGGPLPAGPGEPTETISLLAKAARAGGVVASGGPRYFGFVVGGALPVSVAADWLVSAWDQNSGVYDLGPATATAEYVTAQWLVELFGLPAGTSVGFPTGCAMAHLTALATARHHVLAAVGWDVERDGLRGAPEVHIVASAQRHLTIERALRYLGLGVGRTKSVGTDAEGRMRPDLLRAELARCDGPTIVCTQVGDVNSGAIDPVGEICDSAHEHGAWVHVDGAFGLWAAASPALRPLLAGIERADSWASDAHKWLNVPYDCGLVFVRNAEDHRAAMLNARADYLPDPVPGERDPIEWVPDFSRRARSLPVWAALRTLGRSGVAAQIERGCALARRFAAGLAAIEGAEVLNEVALNQVLVRFAGDDTITRGVIERLQERGVSWFGGTTWNTQAAMRVSVTSWRTTESDVDTVLAEIRAVFTEVLSATVPV